jgi:hypothetical protein
MRTFNIINQSSKISETDLQLMVEACKIQLRDHAATALERMPWDIKIGGDDGFPMIIFDNSDQAGALGYHSQDPNGKVWGRVFVNPVLDHGGTIMNGSKSVSVVLSHEILETFYNPYINLWSNRGDETFVAIEICDPVEDNCYEIEVNGNKVSVSNFVLEAWFDKEMANVGKFDYLSTLKSPLSLAHGGYNIIFNSETGEIKSVFASQQAEELHNFIKPSHPAARTSRNILKKFKTTQALESNTNPYTNLHPSE